MNGDGTPDLILSGTSVVWVMLGNGDGSFQAPLISNLAYSVGVVADFNGDGKVDLVTGSLLGIGIAIGNGDGTFQAPLLFNASTPSSAAVPGDFNGDGKPDLAVAVGGIGVAILTNTTR